MRFKDGALPGGGIAAACLVCCAPPIIAALGLTAGLAVLTGIVLGVAAAAGVGVIGIGAIIARRQLRAASCEPSTTEPVEVPTPTRRPPGP